MTTFAGGIVIKSIDVNKSGDAMKKSDKISIELTDEEAKILIRACRKYRSTIPSYIMSKKDEINTLDELVQKLTKNV